MAIFYVHHVNAYDYDEGWCGDYVEAETAGKAKYLFLRKSDWSWDLSPQHYTELRAQKVKDVDPEVTVIREGE